MTDANQRRGREPLGVIRALPFLFARDVTPNPLVGAAPRPRWGWAREWTGARGGKAEPRHRGLRAAPTGWRGAIPKVLASLTLGAYLSPALAAEIPHVSAKAEASYQHSYRYAGHHKAFAIAPGGGWSWRADGVDPQSVGEAAIAACAQHTAQRCVLYDLDGQTVFDEQQWPTLWRPYLSAEEAADRPVGTARGERFPDLTFRDRDNGRYTLSDLQGQVVILHFWGSWCPPCMKEFPELLRFQEELKGALGDEVKMVLLQAREPFSQSLRWATRNGFDALPLHDSCIEEEEHSEFTTIGGDLIPDRELAPRFPTSYVLDRNGVILMRHKGPIEDWSEYLPFLRDVVERTGG